MNPFNTCNFFYKTIILLNHANLVTTAVLVQLNVEDEPCNADGLVVPFHAVREIHSIEQNKCTWRCAEGFFSTKRRGLSFQATTIAVCKPCSSSLSCEVGFTARQCTRTEDSKCVLCPSLDNAEGETYHDRGNCDSKTCKEGYITKPNSTTGGCSICPLDHFCLNNRAIQCQENCTTQGKLGSSTPFACLKNNGQSNEKNEYTTLITQTTAIISSSTEVEPNQIKCPTLNQAINQWLQHGILQDCSIDILSSFHAIVACNILVSPCFASHYKTWLSEKFSEHHSSTFQSIFQCLQLDSTQQLSVGNPIIQQSAEMLKINDRQSNLNVPPNDPPILTIEPKKWYLDNNQILISIGFFYLLILALSFSLILVCALFVLKFRRKRVTDFFYKELSRHRQMKPFP